VLYGKERGKNFDEIKKSDVVITSYPLLLRDLETHDKHHYHLLVLDEAQNIKNSRSSSAKAVSSLKAKHRLCLSGTPLENHLGELWSLFNFLMPGFLGDETYFKQLYRNPIEKHGDFGRQRSLAQRVKPFLLRRTKELVAKELPAKTETVVSLELEDAQRDLYETLRVSMHERVRGEIENKGLARSQIMILDALLKLRQACCDPRLVKLEKAKRVRQSTKLEWLRETLPNLIDEGRKVLVFSQFTSMLELIEEDLAKLNIVYAKLTGDTKDRKEQVELFQSGRVPLFLLSLKAGGVGLNLTAADTVIHYDPWWNPAAENQATDRAHRIGQERPVFVYKLIAQGSLEEKILELQARKAALAKGILEGGAGALAKLTMEDLEFLFQPLE
jgi:SNF2 family DNA or RNA helicase